MCNYIYIYFFIMFRYLYIKMYLFFLVTNEMITKAIQAYICIYNIALVIISLATRKNKYKN